MFAHINFSYPHSTVIFLRGVARLLGFRRHDRPVILRTPPSAR
jgi:hypothetical protein